MKRIKPNEIRQQQRWTATELHELSDAERDWRLELQADGERAAAEDTEREEHDGSH